MKMRMLLVSMLFAQCKASFWSICCYCCDTTPKEVSEATADVTLEDFDQFKADNAFCISFSESGAKDLPKKIAEAKLEFVKKQIQLPNLQGKDDSEMLNDFKAVYTEAKRVLDEKHGILEEYSEFPDIIGLHLYSMTLTEWNLSDGYTKCLIVSPNKQYALSLDVNYYSGAKFAKFEQNENGELVITDCDGLSKQEVFNEAGKFWNVVVNPRSNDLLIERLCKDVFPVDKSAGNVDLKSVIALPNVGNCSIYDYNLNKVTSIEGHNLSNPSEYKILALIPYNNLAWRIKVKVDDEEKTVLVRNKGYYDDGMVLECVVPEGMGFKQVDLSEAVAFCEQQSDKLND